jgi:hypothetical protein
MSIAIITALRKRTSATVTVTFANSVTPASLKWSLVRGDGSVVNGRDQIAIAPEALGPAIDIALDPADMELAAGAGAGRLFLALDATYLDGGVPKRWTDSVELVIHDVPGVA